MVKRTAWILASMLFLVACSDKKKKEAAAYNDAVVNHVEMADSIFSDFVNADMMTDVTAKKQSALAQLQTLKDALTKMQPYDKDDTLRMNAGTILDYDITFINNDYSTVYEVMRDSVFYAEDSIRVDSIMSKLFETENMQQQTFTAMQKRFAERHGFVLE